jgi:hypothetical protein
VTATELCDVCGQPLAGGEWSGDGTGRRYHDPARGCPGEAAARGRVAGVAEDDRVILQAVSRALAMMLGELGLVGTGVAGSEPDYTEVRAELRLALAVIEGER